MSNWLGRIFVFVGGRWEGLAKPCYRGLHVRTLAKRSNFLPAETTFLKKKH